MSVNIEQRRDIILAQVGAGLEGDDAIDQILLDKVTPQFDTIWAKWQWKNYWPTLQELYVKRDCIEILQGQFRDLVDSKLGANLTINQSAIMGNLATLHAQTENQIVMTETQARASLGPSIGDIRRKTFKRPRSWTPNPSSDYYRGDPTYPGMLVDGDYD